MRRLLRASVILTGLALAASASARAQMPGASSPRAGAQNPSPMVETTRRHERIERRDLPGRRLVVGGVLPEPVHVFVPASALAAPRLDLLVHFHGAPFVAEHAVTRAGRPYASAVANLGAGSAAYEQALAAPGTLSALVAAVVDSVRAALGRDVAFGRLVLSGFSAGCGALRAIARDSAAVAAIDGFLFLDGIHTSYVPERTVLHDGGALDTARLQPVARLARLAADGRERVVITHSEVFPGTFASTTETADWLLAGLGLKRSPVLEWGPAGMQLLGRARARGLEVLAFAGNAAPDHLDHLHALPALLRRLD